MAKYHGKTGRLYASTTGSGTAVPVASLTDWTLDTGVERVDTTAFGANNRSSVQGFPSYTGTFAGFWDDSDTTLKTASQSADGTKLYLYPATGASSKYAFGPAWIDLSFSTGVGDAVKMSGSFSAKDDWTNNL